MSTQDLGQYISAVRQNGIRLNANEPLVVAGAATFSGAVTFSGSVSLGAETITSASANAFTVGPNGTTNPVFNIDASASSAATGLNVAGAAATSGVAVSVLSSGTNENLKIDAKGSGTITLGGVSTGKVIIAGGAGGTGALQLGDATLTKSTGNKWDFGGSGVQGITTLTLSSVTSGNALTVSQSTSTTNPAFKVDTSTASSATGIQIKSAAAAAGVALTAISSGTNEALTIDAKGSGAIVIGGTSTGQVSIGRGSVGSVIESSTIAALGTVQNSTPTATQLLGGVVTQTGATGAGTVTLPTGTQLSTAVTGVTVGDTFDCVYANLGGGFNEVITGATGSTVVGNATVPSGKNAFLTFVNTGANTWNVYVTVSA